MNDYLEEQDFKLMNHFNKLKRSSDGSDMNKTFKEDTIKQLSVHYKKASPGHHFNSQEALSVKQSSDHCEVSDEEEKNALKVEQGISLLEGKKGQGFDDEDEVDNMNNDEFEEKRTT